MGHGRLVVGRLSTEWVQASVFRERLCWLRLKAKAGGMRVWGWANLSQEVKSLRLEPQPEEIPRYGQP